MTNKSFLELVNLLKIAGYSQALADTDQGWVFFPNLLGPVDDVTPAISVRYLGENLWSFGSNTASDSDNGPVTRLGLSESPAGFFEKRPFYNMSNNFGTWVLTDGTLQLSPGILVPQLKSIFNRTVVVVQNIKVDDIPIQWLAEGFTPAQLADLDQDALGMLDVTIIGKGEWPEGSHSPNPSALLCTYSVPNDPDLVVTFSNAPDGPGAPTPNRFYYMMNYKSEIAVSNFDGKFSGEIFSYGGIDLSGQTVELTIMATFTLNK